jgi:hypothetical protein
MRLDPRVCSDRRVSECNSRLHCEWTDLVHRAASTRAISQGALSPLSRVVSLTRDKCGTRWVSWARRRQSIVLQGIGREEEEYQRV